MNVLFSTALHAAAAIVGSLGLRSALDVGPPSRTRAPVAGPHWSTSERSLADWSSQTARKLRAGTTITEVVTQEFPVRLSRRGTLAERLRRSLASDLSSDERLVVWVTYSVLTFGIPGGAAFERTAERLSLRQRLRHERELHSAPARLSTRALTALPLATLALLVATSTSVRQFVHSTLGVSVLLTGLVLNECGRRTSRAVIDPSRRRRQKSNSTDLTDTFEAVALVVMAGTPLRTALVDSPFLAPPTVREQFEKLAIDLNNGALLTDALEKWGQQFGGVSDQTVITLIEGQRNGSPLSEILRELVNSVDETRTQLEASYIRTLPIRLAGPLVGCSLPAFVCLAIVPPLAGSLAGLSSSPLSTL